MCDRGPFSVLYALQLVELCQRRGWQLHVHKLRLEYVLGMMNGSLANQGVHQEAMQVLRALAPNLKSLDWSLTREIGAVTPRLSDILPVHLPCLSKLRITAPLHADACPPITAQGLERVELIVCPASDSSLPTVVPAVIAKALFVGCQSASTKIPLAAIMRSPLAVQANRWALADKLSHGAIWASLMELRDTARATECAVAAPVLRYLLIHGVEPMIESGEESVVLAEATNEVLELASRRRRTVFVTTRPEEYVATYR